MAGRNPRGYQQRGSSMADEMSTSTISTAMRSEIRATAVNIKAQRNVSIPFVDEQLKRMRHDYGFEFREISQLILMDLESLGDYGKTDDKGDPLDAEYDALVNSFTRMYIGG
jgi:hypothetical protein